MGNILQLGLLALALAAAGPAETPRSVARTLTVAPDKCLIYGTAVDVDATPVPNAPVRLRNLQSRLIEQTSATNSAGEFSFVAQPDIAYVVEIADQPGRVIAVGDVVVPRAGEMAGGTVVIPGPIAAGFNGLFRASAGAVASAVAGAGMTLKPPPVSPEK